jgi:hypothetical protein
MNPNATAEILNRLHEQGLQFDFGTNTKLPDGLMKLVASSDDEYYRARLALNVFAPAALLKTLSGDPDEIVRAFVGGNPNTPVSVLQTLARDEDWQTRRSVAENPSTPLETLLEMAEEFGHFVVKNKSASSELILKILENFVSQESE